jgi:hypothetical protein
MEYFISGHYIAVKNVAFLRQCSIDPNSIDPQLSSDIFDTEYREFKLLG